MDINASIVNSPKYKLVAVISDIQTGSQEEIPKGNFLKLEFRNKGIEAVNISNNTEPEEGDISFFQRTLNTRVHPLIPIAIHLRLHNEIQL